MSESTEEVSAFAIYSKKRESSDSLSPKSSTKKKKVQPLNTSTPKKLQSPDKKIIETKISPDLNKKDDISENMNTVNPVNESNHLFKWLIYPLSPSEFFIENWERAPLHIQRKSSKYYKVLMSTPMIDDILKKFNILYTKNLDITSYSNGVRETHNPPGRAHSSVVWDYYSNGCSVRMLNPQTFIPKIHTLNSTLQEYFNCFVGANFYLTPPGSQGFAPHYDDIEAFILQIEGKKRWRLYKPRNDAEFLPRLSSENFKQSEIGEPILDVVVEAGDLLYFPRGTIHQGETLEDAHSLHITLSVYQKNSWGDFLEKLIPAALNKAIANKPDLRRGLPLNYLNHIGAVHSKKKSSDFRKSFQEMTKKVIEQVVAMIDIDAAADQMAKDQIHDYLPPALAPEESQCSVLENGERMAKEGRVVDRVEIEPDTKIRLARAHCVRLVHEDDNSYKLYYSCDNSKEYHEYDLQFLEVEDAFVPAIKKIIRTYPNFIKVDDLPVNEEDNRVQIARDLWEKSIVLTDVPLLEVE
ncbi:ribosomal oxygenase 1 [Chelonus insularis]|uniref:ribosomal oxygenase 1 n=1 Tax=Chelonus insularis TaxID=460826 RepID=UPI00158DC8A0|nr:ribosomal oxygenase 1 [Chelonus insularis]XP_034943446.1 ribosomal oxygenase 1 [Chelonus insularis]